MEYKEIKVPVQYKYLSDWHELLGFLPQTGKYILNKVNTGCGGTTLFLQSSDPLILVSPRSNMLYSKSVQFPNAHLFRKKTDTSTSVAALKEKLRNYLNLCDGGITPWATLQPRTPKILVTIDSFHHVAEQLSYMGILDQFTVVVDEFQCLMSDSKFKGKTELEFLHNLRGVKSVCYLSATPIDESYIDYFPDFDDVSTYNKLIWHPSALESPNLEMRPYKAKQSSNSICKDIITYYRHNGFFAQKVIDGNIVNSKEVVIFLNDVRAIVQIIKDNNLDPDEVNVLCSPSNKHIKDLKLLGVHIGELATDPNNPSNRTFTFATRASFEGVDFYSSSAFTYIFSDGILDWNKCDLITDTPQILGRQRLDQPFRKDAVLYYRANSRIDASTAEKRIKEKEAATLRWMEKFNASDDETKMMLKDGIDKRSEKTRYADDYVEFVDDINGGFVVRENYLVMCTEIRDWQLSSFVYNSPISIIKTVVDNTNISVTSTYGFITKSANSALDQFKHDFFKATAFPDKMLIYSDMRTQHPEYTNDLYQNAFIEIKYHQYYDVLGAEKIKSLRYREKDIATATASMVLLKRVSEECKTTFSVGNRYRLSDVKCALQAIYNRAGIKETAKAKDIEKFMPNAEQRQLTTPGTVKRELYYEIL